MSYTLERANDGLKKFMVRTPSGKRVKFGQNGAPDYTIHSDFEADSRRQNYIVRHAGNPDGQSSRRENWNDPSTPGFWSRWLLWEKRTIESAIQNLVGKYGITDIKYDGRNYSSGSRRVASPSRRVASPSRRVASPSRRVASPSRRVTTPPRRVTTPPRRVTSP